MSAEKRKPKNWKRIAEDLKSGRNFCIHGATFDNARAILKSHGSFAIGHYFLAGDEEMKLNNETFFDKLRASIEIAARYSEYGLELKEEGIYFNSLPTLILGIGGEERAKIIEKKSGVYSFIYQCETFPISHDFYREGENKIEMVYLGYRELEEICKKTAKVRDKYMDLEGIFSLYYAQNLVVNGLTKKIHERISNPAAPFWF